MTEHSPSPTLARGVYGYVLYLVSTSAIFTYSVWAFVPDFVLHSIGITYYPQKYWAVAIPVYLLMALALFTFFLYPALNQQLAPELGSMSTITDRHANLFPVSSHLDPERIPPVADLDISHVCRTLYLRS